MQDEALLQRGAQGAVQPVLQVERPAPGDHVREEVAVEGGVGGEQRAQVQLGLVVTSWSSRTCRGGTADQSFGVVSPWSG